jgi:glycosyltransferase involved in cell wall biosynthesis
LTPKINFAGKVPYARLADRYREADVLVFPALRDSGGSALLEAMARFVPVVCLDWAGPGEMIDKNSGVKIPVLDPAATVTELGHALAALATDPERRAAIAACARERAQAVFRWQTKRDLLEATYQRLIAN